ncbi:probable elongator complex protein 2 isoform X2 [Varroa destructor]|uniref:Elongator complex protein 2 n=1 Tax=Varroa destructor TaxID=109461 RepID=A0A7M7KB72_VARDE|nr:probable elongator complex protein 2 isoform X2 [Varroa destructor]
MTSSKQFRSDDTINATLEYCSVACNNTPGCLCWSYPSSGIRDDFGEATVFYSACNALIEYDFEFAGGRGSTKRVISGHTGKITSVSCSSDNCVLTCSRDGSCRLWKHGSLVAKMKADSALMCGDVAFRKNGSHWVAAGSTDDTVRVWNIGTGSLPRQICSVRRGRDTPLCVRLHAGPVRDTLLLFVAWTSCELQVLELVEASGDQSEYFSEVCVLTGHEDWIRGIDVRPVIRERHTQSTIDELLVASCGQDSLIRVWRLGPFRDLEDEETTVPRAEFKTNGVRLQAELETVLEGHSGWVYSVRWGPGQDLRLLSASIDKSLIVWSPAEAENCDVWIERLRVGGVGGNNLGFIGAVWDHTGDRILGHGFHGSLHLWHKIGDRDQWKPCVVPGGHFRAVTGLTWSPGGSYLLSCSTDQTTRVHGKWRKPEDKTTVWRELARPQVHGHDLFCIAALSETAFVSGAEEKVLRSFNATRNFVANINRISGETLVNDVDVKLLPEGASVAALGLSNKALYESDIKFQVTNEGQNDDLKYNQEDFYFRTIELTAPPHEEDLAQNTLWHEVRKLYGHGYEVFTCAASADGLLVASSCKAQSVKHAAVLLWDTRSWKVIQRLEHHQLTVTCVAFSDDGQRILTVSRDRTWVLWEKPFQGTDREINYVKVAYVDKSCNIHQRVIWACAFAPKEFSCTENGKGGLFGTCSRDKKVVIWKRDRESGDYAQKDKGDIKDCLADLTGGWRPCLIFCAEDSARSLAFSSAAITSNGIKRSLFLAIGLDNGFIELRQLVFNTISGDLEIVIQVVQSVVLICNTFDRCLGVKTSEFCVTLCRGSIVLKCIIC